MARRIVTANNAEGRSYFVSDEEIDNPYLWESSAADPLGVDSGGAEPDGARTYFLPSTAHSIDPSPGGTKCVRFAMDPWVVIQQNQYPGLDPDGFHRTASIDYIMILSGEVDLLLDEGRTTVRAGDLVVQRNTNHAWHNMTDQPTEFWGVMVSVPTQ
ncbi:MAG: Cupin 2 barrel protein [Rhodospirillales bacterium]|nr:Cupin 2 barrel protein [Rhodospirillales bacterium]